jgi:hypothetical protein
MQPVKISTIDQKTRIVTFTMPSGEKQKVKVDPSVLGLEKFKAGDDVMVEFVDDTCNWFCNAEEIIRYIKSAEVIWQKEKPTNAGFSLSK